MTRIHQICRILKISQYILPVFLISVLIVCTLFSGNAHASPAPEPKDSSTSICDELNSSDPLYPSYCSDRDNNNANSNGGNAATDTSSPILGPNSILYKVVQFVTMMTGVASVIMIIVGGFRYVTSGGDSASTKGAKDTILYAVIGLAITIFAQTIIIFVLSKL